MIEIESPATPQPSSLLPPRRRRSPNDAPGASREHCRCEKYDPIAAREHSLATLYPSKSSLTVIPTARQQSLRPALVDGVADRPAIGARTLIAARQGFTDVNKDRRP